MAPGPTFLVVLGGLLAIAGEAAPLGLAPDALPSPDFLAALLLAAALRRPDAVPLLATAPLGLLRDALTDAPLGIGALTLVLAVEALKARGGGRRDHLSDWLRVALALALMGAAQWLAMVVSFAQPPYLTRLGAELGLSLAIWPLMALLAGLMLRPRWRGAGPP